MADQKILREYLLSLGFKADPSLKKMDTSLKGFDKGFKGLGVVIGAVTTAATAMVTTFANSMEKLYYASKLSQSSASNLQANAYAAKQVGLSAEQVNGAVKNLAQTIRLNPGVRALLEGFGVKVEGRDMSDVFKDVISTFGKMPDWLGTFMAGEAGIDPETFYLMKLGLDDFNKAQERQKELSQQAGVELAEWTEKSKAYNNAIREMTEKLDLLGKRLAITLFPIFERLNSEANSFVDKLLRIFAKYDTWEKFKTLPMPKDLRLENWIKSSAGGMYRGLQDMYDSTLPAHKRPWRPGQAGGGRGFVNPGTTQGDASLSTIESKYGLPRGILDYVWKTESNRGDPRFMRSRAGAEGDMGFMPRTAKEWGVDVKDRASSFDGAGRYIKYLLSRYNGDSSMALAAYNWGLGNVDEYGLSGAPTETRKYVSGWEGASMQAPQTNITIYGDNPQTIAEAVGERLERVNADYVRNLSTVLK